MLFDFGMVGWLEWMWVVWIVWAYCVTLIVLFDFCYYLIICMFTVDVALFFGLFDGVCVVAIWFVVCVVYWCVVLLRVLVFFTCGGCFDLGCLRFNGVEFTVCVFTAVFVWLLYYCVRVWLHANVFLLLLFGFDSLTLLFLLFVARLVCCLSIALLG